MKEIDYPRFMRIMTAMMNGRRVDKDDMNYFASTYEAGDPAVKAKLFAKIDSGEKFNDEDYHMLFDEARKLFLSPENKAKTLEAAQKAEQGKMSENIRTGLNLLLSGTDIATSISQIRRSDQMGKSLRRPSRPPILQRDALLSQALAESADTEKGVDRALLPAREGNREQYQNDLSAARTASGGQAAAYGAYAQGASLRRDKANLELVPLGEQVRARNQNRYDTNVGRRLEENKAINQSQSQNYLSDLYQYNLDRNVVSDLGQTGRRNLRSSVYGAAQDLPGAISRYGTSRKYDDIYNRMSMYGPKNAQIAADAHHTSDTNWGSHQDSPPIYDYEESYF